MKKFRRLSAVVVLVVALFVLFADDAHAALSGNSNVQIQVLPNTPDVCPNIPGHQETIPPGMEHDANGNCYTPTPPEPPEPPPVIIDLCNNIAGVQAVIPAGHYRTANGNCYLQPAPPTPPVDVCSNLDGVQTEVPDGYYLDPETNTCLEAVLPPEPPASTDICLNIPGVQTTTPEGMENDNGYCYTPIAPVTPEEPPLKNVPDFLQSFARAIVNFVPESVREFFRGLPDEVVGQIPIYVFILILILILIPILQSIREYIYQRRLAAFYKREKDIAEEKENFITLASHYIRTPITIMKSSIGLMLSAGELPQGKAAALNASAQNLSDQVSASLDAVEHDPRLKTAADLSMIKPRPFWRSGFFWLPIIISIILTIIANFLIGVVGDKEIGVTNAMFQLFIIVVFIVAVYLIVRNYQIQKKLRRQKDALIEHERAIDTIRNNFLHQQATSIGLALSDFYSVQPISPPTHSYSLYEDGVYRLANVHDKFILLSQIKTGANRDTSTFDLKPVIDRAIEAEQPNIAEKNLNVQNSVGNISIKQNASLFSFVVSSVLNNAIKFTDSGGHIAISADAKSKTIRLTVSDNGQGIDPSKVSQLFKPFSRAESAVDFSYEGMGLSLFLDRLILTYTGGEISVAPRSAGGTDVTIVTPINVTADKEMKLADKDAGLK